ncbi:protein kinase [Corallococcus sp. H22C18031201]|nr:protein kinase [Corallococcus sp. H22C18031201]
MSQAYAITETLHEGGRLRWYRATRLTDGRSVLLKVLDPQRGQPEDVEQLRHEQALAGALGLPALVRPLAWDTWRGMPALVLEDSGGQPLERLMGGPMPLERFLELAVRIAAVVAALHARDVLHKDLKPLHLLVHPTTSEVKLTGLGLASRLPRHPTPAPGPRRVEGSLPYLAPEQTGRTHRAPDLRADLYALGVTLYQLLTGRLPFEAGDALEWIHCHVARPPRSPFERVPDLPRPVGELLLKLLAKMPEDRYQSARGLEDDLARCLEQWRAHGRIEPFALDARQVSGRLQPPRRLYGRDADAATLHRHLQHVIDTGTPELLLVSGYSGIGKSTLVRELLAPEARSRGAFVSGKFEQYQRDLPYATFVQAFRERVLELLAQGEERIAAWGERLREALGINGQLVIDVIPQVELLIGPQPPVPEVPPAEARNRFRAVLRRFIGVLTQDGQPLVLLLDDLQWADSASLALLQDLLTAPHAHPLFIVGTYRDNEVTPRHPLAWMRDEARRGGARITNLELGPLSEEDVTALLADTLRGSREDVAPLAGLVHEKTAGNPFFTLQFLAALYAEHLLEFDGQRLAWRWDLERIRAKGFTDNVAEFMAEKLRRLPRETQEALGPLANLGPRAGLDLLARFLDRDETQTRAALEEAVRAGLLRPEEERYAFVHDRVREAAASRVPDEARAALHLRLGRMLRARLTPESPTEERFAAAHQLNLGRHLITAPAEREDLRRLDMLVAARAKAAVAYASARDHLRLATELLPEDAWAAHPAETFALYLERSECEYLAGDFACADALFHQLVDSTRSDVEHARIAILRMRLYQVSGRYSDGVDAALEALARLGVTFPETVPELRAATQAKARAVPEALRGRPIAELEEAPVVTDPRVRAILDLLAEAIPCASISRPELFPVLALEALHVSLREGNTEASCFAYSAYGSMRVSVFQDIPSAFAYSEMSLRLNARFHDVRRRGMLLHLHGNFIHSWGRPFSTTLPIVEEAFRACLEVGDLVFAGYLSALTVWLHWELGEPLDAVLEASRPYAAFARDSHNEPMYQSIRAQQQFVAALRGRTRGPTRLDDASFDAEACLEELTRVSAHTALAFFHVIQELTALIQDEPEEALEAALRAAPWTRALMGLPIEATHAFALGLTLTSPVARAADATRLQTLPSLQSLLDRLEHWAEHSPRNYRAPYLLLSAEVARVEGREAEAARLYPQAALAARTSGLLHHEALAHERAAAFHRARGADALAAESLRDARAAYVRWGAEGKVRRLDQRHPSLAEVRAPPSSATVAVSNEQLDLLAVVKASQIISGVIERDELIRTLLRVVLEQGGAQRGVLVLAQGDDLLIEAEATLEGHRVETALHPSLPVVTTPTLVPPSLLRYAALTGARVLLDDASLSERFSQDPYIAQRRPRAVLALPVRRQARVVGLLYLENNLLTGAFTPERLAALELLASQAAISLENAQLLARERTSREAAEAERHRSTFLAEAGALLSESLDADETLARLGRLSVRSLADWCVIDLVMEGGGIRRLAGAHADPAKEPLLQELRRRYPPRRDAMHVSSSDLRHDEPLLLPDLSEEFLRGTSEDDTQARLLRELGTRSVMVVPLMARGQDIGVLTLASGTPGRWSRADQTLIQEVARRAAIAIDNARLHQETQRAVRMRDEFLSMAAHELRTPFTSLRLQLQSLQRAVEHERVHLPDPEARKLSRALSQTNHLVELVKTLLDVSQVSGGPVTVEPGPVDLAELAREVTRRFAEAFARVGSRLVLHTVPCPGQWDGPRLEQVLTNLLTNALKFGAGRPIEVTVEAEPGLARLTVRDHGIGIDRERQPRLFERYGRGVSASHYGGLGLGLYLSRKVVEAHGGSIHVHSQPGAGATFTVELPRATQRARADGT